MANTADDELIQKRYQEEFADCPAFVDVSDALAQMNSDPDIDALRELFCSEYLHFLCAGYAKYADRETAEVANGRKLLIENVRQLPHTDEYSYYYAVVCFFEGDQSGCIRNIRRFLKFCRPFNEEVPLAEIGWADLFLDPYKNAYPEFWPQLANLLKDYPCDEEVVDLCYLVDKYYKCTTDDEMVDLLLPFAAEHPHRSLPKELLGFSYIGNKMWNNALACFEQVLAMKDTAPVLFYSEDIHFQMAWCYGKLKDLKKEENHYRRCLERNPLYINASNNLGYSLYKQKRYSEALTQFDHCLKEKIDLPYAANNYVRTLLAAGQYKAAHEFIDSKEYKVASDLVKRARKHKANDHKMPIAPVSESDSEDTDPSAEDVPPDFGIKRQQFSSEKVLEDELSARIEAGREVFGRKLRIYKRAGDFYGRQYPIAQGKWRLDLLCEDPAGDIVVIELKKDSGYDDAYQQTRNYVEWLDKHFCRKGQKVHGIICLNSPSDALIEKVRHDDRISLYEYQISYREIK